MTRWQKICLIPKEFIFLISRLGKTRDVLPAPGLQVVRRGQGETFKEVRPDNSELLLSYVSCPKIPKNQRGIQHTLSKSWRKLERLGVLLGSNQLEYWLVSEKAEIFRQWKNHLGKTGRHPNSYLILQGIS